MPNTPDLLAYSILESRHLRKEITGAVGLGTGGVRPSTVKIT